MSRALFLLVVACVLFLGTPIVRADSPELKTLVIGAAAPDSKLPGVDGKDYTWKSFADARLLLVKQIPSRTGSCAPSFNYLLGLGISLVWDWGTLLRLRQKYQVAMLR
ncbi:MAG: hypothetical protein K2R98_13260 [Gemmataceae bacterium]|nr:hypothetical protein [Gemmataceae bacterium]